MRVRWFLSAAAVICWAMAAQAQNKISKESAADGVAAKIEELVERDFYKPVDFPSFAGKHPTNADIDRALADLHVSHTRRFMPGTVDYYEVADIYGPWRGASRLVFPPDGEAKYDGIGMNTTIIGGKRFVTHVYDGAAAKKAGILVGDEILTVDGKPFDEIKSFKGQAGKPVMVAVRRTAKAPPVDIPVAVTSISPVRMYFDAIRASGRVVENRGYSIAYFRIWALASRQTNDAVEAMLRSEILSGAHGLILDLRGRWGGYTDELPAMLLEDFADVTFTMRDGRSEKWRETWRKPIIVLVDEGTRSANEILACAIKKRGFAVIGKKTAGAVLSGRAFLLPDTSLLMLAAGTVQVDGEVLEGKGVVPDIVVDAPIPYAMGADPQLDVAVEQMTRDLSSITPWRLYPQQRPCSAIASAVAN
ncbi:S41 family peptidase [Mesorhizobium sp. 1M-11]|uniref:S41 family peptidase n=1 Tax=Mesorhizobium sp. 1M-11 TaxID=1529006 RepID=UPI0006C76476|nr:S41 family peptidase [Mesorhizobium sp. 1M-11]